MLNLKRTGWESYFYATYAEVLPQDDIKEHYAGDECWCSPRAEEVEGGNPPILIIHNAADKRE